MQNNYPLLKSKQINLEFSSSPQKFKKYHKIKYKHIFNSITTTRSGFALAINTHCSLTIKEILAVLKLLKPELKMYRKSVISLLLKPDTIITKKPKDIRMGRGKGAPLGPIHKSHAGKLFCSMYGLSIFQAEGVAKKCLPKLRGLKKINLAQW